MSQDLLQTRERRFTGDVVIRANLFFRDESKRPAHGIWRVMESRLQGDFGVVQAIGIELHFCPAGTSTEKVDGTTFAHHLRGPFPCFRATHGLDDHISAAPFCCDRADRFHGILHLRDLHHIMRTHVLDCCRLGIALHYGDHITANRLGYLDEHQTDRTAADHHHGVTDLHASFVQAAQHAS